MKRLIFCFDGTTNTLDAPYSTNVVKVAQSLSPLAKGTAQLIYYDKGVGTDEGEKLSGAAFGAGLDKNLYEAYAFLIFNYTPGDELYVFGFSRGAYTARSFAGLLYNCGIIRRRDAGTILQAINFYRSRDQRDDPLSDKMMEFRREHSPLVCVDAQEDEWRCRVVPNYVAGGSHLLRIKYLGVWDTVGALGIPAHLKLSALDRRKYQFHDTRLSDFVENARHAVSIDEQRLTFSPTLWSNVAELNVKVGKDPAAPDAPYQQQWFPGDHGSVGGGGDREGLSDEALDWIVDGAREAGLYVDSDPSSRIYEIVPDHREHLGNLTSPPDPTMGQKFSAWVWQRFRRAPRQPGPTELHEVSLSARRRWLDLPENLKDGTQYRPVTLSAVAEKLNSLDPTDYGVGVPLAEQNDPERFIFHRVRTGEDLGEITTKYLGDEARYLEIFNVNRDSMATPHKLRAGATIRIPR